jgi:hypothetical protein
MTCTNTTWSSEFAVQAPARVGRNRPEFIAAIVAVAEAFREALDMRRAAHERCPLDDE